MLFRAWKALHCGLFLVFYTGQEKYNAADREKKGSACMNIGIRLHDTREGNLAQRLAYAKEQGFSCAHLAMSKALRGFSMQDAPRLLTEELAAQVKNDFEASGLECAVLGCYLNLADTDLERRAKTQEIYHAHLRFSRWIGARVVGSETAPAQGVSFQEPAPQSEEAFQLLLDGLRPVVRWAEEEGAVMAIEPVFTHIVSTPERAERMLDAIPSDHLQIILDTVNLLGVSNVDRTDEIIAEAVRRFGDRVRVLHMKDHQPVQPGDQKIVSIACGTGVMRYERLLAFARKYDLPMTLEDTKPENAEAARKYLERIAAALPCIQ